jgi:hypothetical protein
MRIIAELKAGIDPTTTDLITNPAEYWLKDETETPSMTLFDGVIAGNHWEIDGEALQINLAGTTSECWELDGTTLQIKI